VLSIQAVIEGTAAFGSVSTFQGESFLLLHNAWEMPRENN